MTHDEILNFDKEHVWHPYASTPPLSSMRLVESASGVRLKLADGGEVIDGMSSWWAAIHGYGHPEIKAALKNQVEKMSHVMFGGLTHEPAVLLAEKILKIAPSNLTKIFYSDSGSVAVEVAMKMALQYWSARGFEKKKKFASILGGYHGDTWHAMSVCDPVLGMHARLFGGLEVNNFAPCPEIKFDGDWLDPSNNVSKILTKLGENSEETAAVILEPIVQGAGGMRFYHPEYLKQISELCAEKNMLLIADEIATGFGRSGKMFACEHAGISPDIMCIGKALTGGSMSFAATLVSSEVASGISSEGLPFMHGPTFMGNPLACAAAGASLDLVLKKGFLENAERIEKIFKEELFKALSSPKVADVRVLGGIGVIEMKKNVDVEEVQNFLVKSGVWLRPFGKLIYAMPPYVTSNDDLRTIACAMVKAVF